MTDRQTIGQRIRAARTKAGLTAAQLAARLNERGTKMHASQITRYERGGMTPRQDTYEAIMREIAVAIGERALDEARRVTA